MHRSEFKVTINEIKNHEREEALEEKPSWKEVFTGSNLKRTIAASIAMSYQQIVGGSGQCNLLLVPRERY